ncbi:MAG: hypothetical protein VCC99_06280, partial [Alphaproteobacteria bacterium]
MLASTKRLGYSVWIMLRASKLGISAAIALALSVVIAHADEPGARLFLSGRVLAKDCSTPISGAMVEVWHANHGGCYSINQACTSGNPDNDVFNLRGRVFSGEDGAYNFETIKPAPYALGGN